MTSIPRRSSSTSRATLPRRERPLTPAPLSLRKEAGRPYEREAVKKVHEWLRPRSIPQSPRTDESPRCQSTGPPGGLLRLAVQASHPLTSTEPVSGSCSVIVSWSLSTRAGARTSVMRRRWRSFATTVPAARQSWPRVGVSKHPGFTTSSLASHEYCLAGRRLHSRWMEQPGETKEGRLP